MREWGGEPWGERARAGFVNDRLVDTESSEATENTGSHYRLVERGAPTIRGTLGALRGPRVLCVERQTGWATSDPRSSRSVRVGVRQLAALTPPGQSAPPLDAPALRQ